MSSAAAEINAEEYAHLLGIALPQVIHTEVENERSMHVLESLLRKKHRTAEEQRLTELLTLLIEDFEERAYPMPRKAGRPIDMVRHLMDANGLRQTDLLDVFGTASVISEVLNGKRELSKTHIVKLSERFHVSPALFFFDQADTATSPAAIGRVVTFPARGFKVAAAARQPVKVAAAAKRRWPRTKRRPSVK